MYGINKSYKYTIIGHLVNSGTSYLILHTVQCWHACEFDIEKRALPLVLYCSGMIYQYYYRLGFFPIKHNEEGGNIHNEIFNDIPYSIKNRLHANCLQDGFVIYNGKLIFHER